MWEINYDLKKLIPPKKEECRYLKSIKLFIPYKEIGLQVLVRKELELSLFFETILKLIDAQFYNITEISDLIGVNEDIIYDVVGEMSRNELIYLKSNTILLTPKGKDTLKNLIEIKIEKENINRIYINSITGEIMDLENVVKRPTEDNPCLDEVIKIDDEFIYKSFNKFNDFYLNKQEVYNTTRYESNSKKEIYQIVKKEYENLCYAEKTMFIYENTRDKDLIFECKDDSENLYGTIFSKQINKSTGVRRFLKNPLYVRKYFANELALDRLDEEKDKNTNLLIENVLSKKDSNEAIEQYYFKDRYLLDKEYNQILLALKNIKPYEIVIVSGNLESILNYNVIATLQILLDRCKVRIVADEEEYNIDKLKNRVMNHKQKKKNEIKWSFSKNINTTKILLYPYAYIIIDYVPIKLFDDYFIGEVSEITFDEKKVKEQREILSNIV